MKAIFVSATRRFGKSTKTGNAYDMCNVQIAMPVEPKTTESMTYHGYGFEVREMELQADALSDFANIAPFTTVDLKVEPKPTNLTRTWVVGVVADK